MLTDYDKKVIYRARRGLKELDVFFSPYVQQHYAHASDAEKSVFSQIVACEDPDLLDWMMELSTPDDPAIAALLHKIKTYTNLA